MIKMKYLLKLVLLLGVSCIIGCATTENTARDSGPKSFAKSVMDLAGVNNIRDADRSDFEELLSTSPRLGGYKRPSTGVNDSAGMLFQTLYFRSGVAPDLGFISGVSMSNISFLSLLLNVDKGVNESERVIEDETIAASGEYYYWIKKSDVSDKTQLSDDLISKFKDVITRHYGHIKGGKFHSYNSEDGGLSVRFMTNSPYRFYASLVLKPIGEKKESPTQGVGDYYYLHGMVHAYAIDEDNGLIKLADSDEFAPGSTSNIFQNKEVLVDLSNVMPNDFYTYVISDNYMPLLISATQTHMFITPIESPTKMTSTTNQQKPKASVDSSN
jgi:hypothetical protein